MTAHWPDLDDRLDCDAGWRQRFLQAGGAGTYQPVARPVFHCVANAVFGPEGALARLADGLAQVVYLEAGGVALVLSRDDLGRAIATILPPDAGRPHSAGDLAAVIAGSSHRALLTDQPTSWPSQGGVVA